MYMNLCLSPMPEAHTGTHILLRIGAFCILFKFKFYIAIGMFLLMICFKILGSARSKDEESLKKYSEEAESKN